MRKRLIRWWYQHWAPLLIATIIGALAWFAWCSVAELVDRS